MYTLKIHPVCIPDFLKLHLLYIKLKNISNLKIEINATRKDINI